MDRHTIKQVMMNPEDKEWLDANRHYLYTTGKISSDHAKIMYDIYNRLTGEKKRPNGCGSCMRNTIRLVRFYYEKYTL